MEKIKEHSGVKILNWKSADFSRLKIDQAKVNWYQWLAGKKTVIEQLEVFKEEMVLCIQGIFPSGGEGRAIKARVPWMTRDGEQDKAEKCSAWQMSEK